MQTTPLPARSTWHKGHNAAAAATPLPSFSGRSLKIRERVVGGVLQSHFANPQPPNGRTSDRGERREDMPRPSAKSVTAKQSHVMFHTETSITQPSKRLENSLSFRNEILNRSAKNRHSIRAGLLTKTCPGSNPGGGVVVVVCTAVWGWLTRPSGRRKGLELLLRPRRQNKNGSAQCRVYAHKSGRPPGRSGRGKRVC